METGCSNDKSQNCLQRKILTKGNLCLGDPENFTNQRAELGITPRGMIKQLNQQV